MSQNHSDNRRPRRNKKQRKEGHIMVRNKSRLLITVFVAFVFVLSGCATQDSFMSAVKNDNYKKAIEIYEKQIAGNSREENLAQDELINYLDNSWNTYLSGKMPSSEFQNSIRCLEKINEELWIIPELYRIEYEFEEIEMSRERFIEGNTYARNGNYVAAILAYEDVLPEDAENFEKAIETEEEAYTTYLEQIRKKANDLAETGNYEEALTVIRNAAETVWCDEFEDLATEITILQITDALEEAYKSGDSLTVVRICENAFNNPSLDLSDEQYDELTQRYIESGRLYLKKICDAAQAVFEPTKDYSAACAVVQNAIGEASFSSELLSELEFILEEYNSYAPVSLTTLEPVRQAKYVVVGDQWTSDTTYTDVNGTVYDSSKMIYPLETESSLASEGPEKDDESTIAYVLNYQYNTLSGKVIRPYGTFSSDDWGSNYGRVMIYGDGVLIYDANPVTLSTWEPETFSLDVSGVRELEIVIYGRWIKDSTWYGLYERHPKLCLADLMLQK